MQSAHTSSNTHVAAPAPAVGGAPAFAGAMPPMCCVQSSEPSVLTEMVMVERALRLSPDTRGLSEEEEKSLDCEPMESARQSAKHPIMTVYAPPSAVRRMTGDSPSPTGCAPANASIFTSALRGSRWCAATMAMAMTPSREHSTTMVGLVARAEASSACTLVLSSPPPPPLLPPLPLLAPAPLVPATTELDASESVPKGAAAPPRHVVVLDAHATASQLLLGSAESACLPGGHAVQPVAPVPATKVPKGQGAHVDLPATRLYWPVAHAAHATGLALRCPAGHVPHSFWPATAW